MLKKLARIFSAELSGINARLICVEADVNVGLHNFNIVGLADRSLGEARERVNSALKYSGMKPPNRENRKITINLAPAHIKKTGSHYDLAIAVGYLMATGQITRDDITGKLFLGELGLDGTLRPVSGVLSMVEEAAEKNLQEVILPSENANEAAAISSIKVIPVTTLKDVIEILEERIAPSPVHFENQAGRATKHPDFSEVRGQEISKRALLIAAAGKHNILLYGPPGVGKSFLAQAFPGILPKLSDAEAIEATKIWSAAGFFVEGLLRDAPFRAPHHTISPIALVGGGSDPKPGEMSLAHNGVLFLDEFPEFPRDVLESLRAPLESGTVHIARARNALVFPAKFLLIAAMNPCPCGYYGDTEKQCVCSAREIARYQKKISGPLLDRIDLQINVGRVDVGALSEKGGVNNPTSPIFLEQIKDARERARVRAASLPMSERTFRLQDARDRAKCADDALLFIKSLGGRSLSPRAYFRLISVARTIADLEGSVSVSADHLAEAFGYRVRPGWSVN